ncbi:hypothetical protein B0H10DRAFT_2446566 [Mycena sp. CBHHK59/15]|nr:hypothetical protein B0H10DRAFT_2446566 [Mycena sp. CBHHK59/15]
MFNGANNFNAYAAEFNEVKGSLVRRNSPTVVKFFGRPSDAGQPPNNYNGHHAGYPYNPPPTAPRGNNHGPGFFAGASNFNVYGGDINSIDGNFERTDSGTQMEMDLSQMNSNPPMYGNQFSAGAYDNAGPGSYNDPDSSPSVNGYPGRNGWNGDYGSTSTGSQAGGSGYRRNPYERHAAREPRYERPVARSNTRDSNSIAPQEKRGPKRKANRRDPARAQTLQQQEAKVPKKAKRRGRPASVGRYSGDESDVEAIARAPKF